MSKPRRLLVVTSTWPLHEGDARTPFVRNLSHDLARLGWDTMVLAPHAAGALTSERHEDVAVRRFRYMPDRWETLAYGAGGLVNMRTPAKKLLALPFVLAETAAIEHAVLAFRPDIIHAHWLLPQGFCASIPARIHGIPLVTTIHGSDVFALRSGLFTPFKKQAIRASSAITVNSPATRNEAAMLGATTEQLSMIPMPPANEADPAAADLEAWRARFPADAHLVAFAGRLIPEKGPDDLLQAVALAGDPRLHAIIMGTGPLETALRAYARDLGIAERVHFEGWQSPEGVAVRLAASDVFLGPSRQSSEGGVEAQGIVFLEAMRAGLPVLAADSGGIPGLVQHLETGWLFRERDVEAMSRLLTASLAGELDHRITWAGRHLARHVVTRDATAGAFDRLFRGILGRIETRSSATGRTAIDGGAIRDA